MSTARKIAVVGGGVVGITTALAIFQQNPNVSITVFSDKFTPDTTGDGSAGLWMPYLLEGTSPQDASVWLRESFSFYQNLFLHEPESGVSLMSGYVFDKHDLLDAVFWKDIVYGFTRATQEELNLFGASDGAKFTTFIIECTKLLPFLMKKLENYGCIFIKRKVESLEELMNDFNVIVNCTGVMAYHLSQDEKVQPIRGQIANVWAPWVKVFILNDTNYIIPNTDKVILGGTSQYGNWSTEVNEHDKNHILNGCSKLLPSISKAKILNHWVGLRPGRKPVRLEVEKVGNNKHVVHNYGHGGCGVTLSWGCAQHAARLVSSIFTNNRFTSSRL